jgi:HEAT repeat protein
MPTNSSNDSPTIGEHNLVSDKGIVQILNVRNGQAVNVNQVVYVGVKTITLDQILKGCLLQVHSAISSIGRKYDPDLYVKRVLEKEIAQFLDKPGDLDEPNCYLLVAPAGSGKTNLLCDLARERVQLQPTILLLGGGCYLGSETGLLGSIRTELENASDDLKFQSASDAFHCLCKTSLELGRNALILVDAINEHEDPLQMRKALASLLAHASGKPIKLIITCRDYYWNIFEGQFWEGKTFNARPDDEKYESEQFYDFSLDEHRIAVNLYFQSYEITGNLSENALNQCRHPLLLRFFCEAYKGQNIGNGVIQDIRLKELFDQYWSKKLASIAERRIQQGEERLQEWLIEEVSSYLLHLASYMLYHNVRTIPLLELKMASGIEEDFASIRSIFGRIRDEYIILEEKQFGSRLKKTVHVAFVYEEFMEYVMALALIHEWDGKGISSEGILDHISELTKNYDSFAQIFGVIVYLALMLKESHQITLWSLLLKKGLEWQNAIFEAIRKLPVEQVDEGVFDVLAEMLRSEDTAVVLKVLDTLKVERIGKVAPKYFADLVGSLIRIGKTGVNPRFEGESLQISRRASLALRNLPAKLAVPFLVRGFFGMKSDVYTNSKKTLVEMGQSAVDPLISLFENRNLDDQLRSDMAEDDQQILGFGGVRASIAETLGEIGDSRAIPSLVNSLKTERDSWIFWHVRDALSKLRWRPTDDEQKAWYFASQRYYRECVNLCKPYALEPLLHMLDICRIHDDSRDEVVRALGELGNPGAVDPLLALLKETYVSKQAIIEALGKLRDPRAFEPLKAKLKSKSPKERHSAVIALGYFGDNRAVDSLITLKTNDKAFQLARIDALGKLGDKRATALLIGFLRDEDAQIRRQAAVSLGVLGDKQSVQPLTSALQDESEIVRAEAASALGKLGVPRDMPPLTNAQKEGSPNAKNATRDSLSQIRQSTLSTEARVFLISGLAGGTGSGLLLDMAKFFPADTVQSRDSLPNYADPDSITNKRKKKRRKRK